MSYPVVLLPGTLCNEQVWDDVKSRLSPDLDVITMPLGRYNNWEQELLSFENALPKKFILCGFSLGGIAALAMLERFPDRISQLVLVASTALADPAESQKRRYQLLERARKSSELSSIALTMIPAKDKQNLGTDGLQLLLDMANQMSIEQFSCQTQLACSRKNTLSILEKCNIPVHLIFGSDDPACGPKIQEFMLSACTQAVYYAVKGGGHWLPLTHSNSVAEVISDLN